MSDFSEAVDAGVPELNEIGEADVPPDWEPNQDTIDAILNIGEMLTATIEHYDAHDNRRGRSYAKGTGEQTSSEPWLQIRAVSLAR